MKTGSFTGFDVDLIEPGIAWIQFNTPERMNGMTASIKRNLIETVTQAQMDNNVRVIVFTGSGRAFCAGDDIFAGYGTKLAGESLVDDIPHGHDSPIGTYDGLRIISQAVNTAIRNCDKVTIAAMNGVAVQTGFSLALACDFRFASDKARMGSATLRFGLLPDEGGQYLLVQLMGVAKTMDFLMRKRIVSAADALALGLVHEVMPGDELEAYTKAYATELANGPQVSMRLLKRSIYNADEMSWEQSLDEIAAKTAISDHHADTREGVGAFKEKREPHFNQWLEQSADSTAADRVTKGVRELEASVKQMGLSSQIFRQLEQQLLRQLRG